jgi:phage terminase small subunit
MNNLKPLKKGRGRPKADLHSKLTRKQEKFVKELVSNDGMITLREAAINAGYPASSAHTRAYEMTNPEICPHICRAIQAYRDELDEKYGINFKRHLRDLQRIRDLAIENGAYSAAVQAEYRRGQANGNIYINKSEIRHGTIDSMSKEEVLKALKELKQNEPKYAKDVIEHEEEKPNKKRIGTVRAVKESVSSLQ